MKDSLGTIALQIRERQHLKKKDHTKEHIKTFIFNRNLKLVVGDAGILPFSWTRRIDRALRSEAFLDVICPAPFLS